MLKGEMFARIELNLGSERETTLLPRDALVYRGDQPGVYMIEKDAAKFLPVETGLTQEDKVEVVSGLKAGDVVITRGSNLIKDGDRVRVSGPGSGAAGGPGGQRPAAEAPPPTASKPAEAAEQKSKQPPPQTPGAQPQAAR
jgi:hypothetical protein